MESATDLIDGGALRRLRAETGAAFPRLLGYFREDAVKSVAAAEEAMRRGDAAALVRPAHTLKGEALQFGAEPLATLAEQIETSARQCVESHIPPDALVADVARLRPLLAQTLTRLMPETMASAVATRPAVGRRSFGTAVR